LPCVPEIDSSIEFLAGNRTRDIYGAGCLVAQGGANPQAIAQNEVSEIDPRARRTSARCLILRPEPIEGNKTSPRVGLQIVIIRRFKLRAGDEGVLSMDHHDSRGEVKLCVVVGNRALSLATSNKGVGNAETGRQGRSLYVGDGAIVRRGKTFLRDVEVGVHGYTEVAETAGAHIGVHRSCGS